MSKLLLLLLATFWVYASLVKGEYPVTVDDPRVPYTPRLYGRSTVVFNDRMYVYGGQTNLAAKFSNDMYVYDFNEESGTLNMSIVDQKNAGPQCTFCGAVMIDSSRMMILTHEFINDPNTTQSVRPFIFDFLTLTWTTNSTPPTYDPANESVFRVRTKHSTVISEDGMVYVIGGVDYFNQTIFLPSWYYDPKENSYKVVSNYNSTTNYTARGPSAFLLPDGNIGSMLGFEGTRFYPNNIMMVLDTNTKSWIAPINITTDDERLNFPREGGTIQVSPNRELGYLFGGIDSEGGISYTSYHVFALDLKNYNFLKLDPTALYKGFIQDRAYASSAIIKNKYLVIAFGATTIWDSSESRNVDIFRLYENDSSNTTKLEMLLPTPDTTSEDAYYTELGIVIVICLIHAISLVLFIIFVCSANKLMRSKKPWIRSIVKGISDTRIGEIKRTRVISFLARISLVVLIADFILYYLYDIITSSVSVKEDVSDVDFIYLPDIRLCYTGWNNDTFKSPEINCLHKKNIYNGACANITTLDTKNIMTPTFPNQRSGTQCHLYKSEQNSFVTKDSPTVRLAHIGNEYNENQIVHIEFYEPEKDPNRVLYLKESLPGFDLATMDAWIDSEVESGTKENVVNRVVSVYPDSTIFIQFETVTTHKIDPNNRWNHIGFLPKYLVTTELSITHTEVLNRGSFTPPQNESIFLGSVNISPKHFKNRIIFEKRDYTVVSAIGSIGGIISLLLAAQVILLGTILKPPSGIFQRFGYTSNNKKERKENLEKYFLVDNSQSIPFVTPVHQRFKDIHNMNESCFDTKNTNSSVIEETKTFKDYYPEESIQNEKSTSEAKYGNMEKRLNQLEERNQILELVLKSYYIDDRIFKELHTVSANWIWVPHPKDP